MCVTIFDFTLVTVAMVTGKEYGLARSYRQYSKHNCKLLCERDISRCTPVKKMPLSIPKTDSVNVAYESEVERSAETHSFMIKVACYLFNK